MRRRLLTTLARYLHPRGAVSFWHTPIRPVLYNYAGLGDYYIDLTAKTRYKGPYDADGIPLLNYFGPVGTHYNPCATAQWGLGNYQRWRRGEPSSEAQFRRAADWLCKQIDTDNAGRGFWRYRFDFDAYGLRAPWVSALAQAQGISLLLRAYRCWRDLTYLESAKLACNAMLSPIAEGGLLRKYDGLTVLEEVVADRPTAILDGMIFAVLGLQDYCYVIESARAQSVLTECYDTLETLLPRYDLGYWSRADLYSADPPMPASAFYHGLHVALLRVLADLTGRKTFQEYADRWMCATGSQLNRLRAFVSKAYFKLRYY